VRRTKEKKPEPLGFAANAGLGALIALGVAFVLLFIASILVVSGRLPERGMGTITVGVLFVSSLAGAFAAVRRHRSRALLMGLAEGGMLYAITLVGGIFVEMPMFFGGLSVFLFAAAVSGGVVAGLIGVRGRKSKGLR